MRFERGDLCPKGCGAKFGRMGFRHYPSCVLSEGFSESRQIHPVPPRLGRGPHRVVGGRRWSLIEERHEVEGEDYF